MKTTTRNFTRDLFDVLHLEWNSYAQARDLLSGIILSNETIYSIIEDSVFSLGRFLDEVRSSRGIEETDSKIAPFFVQKENNFFFHIGNEEQSDTIFIITVDWENENFIFHRALESSEIEKNRCLNLTGLKKVVLSWFSEFYKKYEESAKK